MYQPTGDTPTTQPIDTVVEQPLVIPTKIKKVADINSVARFVVRPNKGLDDSQIATRYSEGLINRDSRKHGKSILGIVLSNIFTFFNILYLIIGTVLAIYQQWEQMTFLVIIVANTGIAIVQEIKAKKTLDKLNLVTIPTVIATRNGKQIDVATNELVLDDIYSLQTGNGIPTDSIVVDGVVEVNESILTGESDALVKKKGDTLFAGSYVVSGNCQARADKVGKYNYIASLTSRAKQYSKPNSQMLKSLKGILIAVAIIILPMTFYLWEINYAYYNKDIIQTLVKTSGAIISMIPAGPFLLTSVALAVSVIRLVKRKTMVQELYCIEMLARVDCLCLDKTGTITDGTMKVVESIDLRQGSSAKLTIREIMSAFLLATKDDNVTAKALKKYFGQNRNGLRSVSVLPFSSQRKLSAVSFEGQGTYILGAPEFVLTTASNRVNDLTQKYASQGLRVLVLAHSPTTVFDEKLPAVRRPVAVIAIEDRIRPDAKTTIAWFVENGVDIRVISGDNAITVGNIAKRVGIADADKCISLENMTDEEVIESAKHYKVFGRVTPDQKALLIKALKSLGHTVAMTGDGVNDILAMKQSDCSISLANGADAARNVAHLVMMDNDFSCLPDVVAEGRRVVNNIQSATTMYFMKTVYVIFINIALIILNMALHVNMPTPFSSIQVFLLDTVIVGITTTLLALQPNHHIIRGNFLSNVLAKCLPASFTFILSTVSIYMLDQFGIVPMPGDILSTVVSISYIMGGLFMLFYACKPFNKWKKIMYASIWVIVMVALIFFPQVWHYSPLNTTQILLLLVECLAIPIVLYALISVASKFNYIKNIKKHATKSSSKDK